ncbi:transglutaminase-like cysteine peptidase [Bradyrhizobium japonicum]|uniref:transglutaminase-like cysteine peptidase n=1 Tax=Bradyrhizobium japonicum TaxID=375 RepID=UPI001BA4A426|nr:transglutaminase-like cysteine peptidase [Bradyrhizobium japonicum]MBR0916312.1 transglutaminase-like cysteine peptidase [Bradyrhizobium japonicum]
MREIPKFAAVMIALLSAAISDGANAGISDMSRGLRAQLERIQLSVPALAPMAHVRFCMDYPAECTVRRRIFRGGPVKLTSSRWSHVVQVNNTVNGTIMPTANLGGLATETWIVGPQTGDCNDYAVTKRHELLARGWPARALLLSEVITSSGEHHLVLVVRTASADLVLDNLTAEIRVWSKTPYRFARMQTPGNARLWATIVSWSSRRERTAGLEAIKVGLD